MKYFQFTAVILFLIHTEVRGRMKTVRCEIDDDKCTIRLVDDSQPIFEDPDPDLSVNVLEITGKFERIPGLLDAARKFTALKIFIIRNVGLKIFNGENLVVFERIAGLYIEENEITFVDTSSFKELRDLEVISLQKNSLEVLPASIFNNNKKLVEINFHKNKLNEIHGDTFKGLEHLAELDISYNELEILPANLFRDNKAIYSLHLNNNKLKEIHGDTLKELPKLSFLYCANNQIETLPSTIFRNNKKLRRISLEDNKLKAIDRDTFKGLNQLEDLWLRHNEIDVLPRGLFDDNTELSYIRLSNNKLIKIETNLRNLRKLDGLTLIGNVCIDQSALYATTHPSLLNKLMELINNIEQRC